MSLSELSAGLSEGSNETRLTNNLPGTKNIDKVENQEPKAYQELVKLG